jgi:hypothetical protein
LFLAVSSHAGQVWAGGEELAVVVGPKSSVSGLSFYELKQLYMGERLKTPTGEWMVPLNRKKDTSERIGFDDSVLGMSPDVVGSYWIDRKIRGQSGPPKAIASAALILKLVEKVPGAIGYVALSEAKDVKIVKIDGKLPGQSGYGIGT